VIGAKKAKQVLTFWFLVVRASERTKTVPFLPRHRLCLSRQGVFFGGLRENVALRRDNDGGCTGTVVAVKIGRGIGSCSVGLSSLTTFKAHNRLLLSISLDHGTTTTASTGTTDLSAGRC
jgi:hypothetical protein